MTNSFIEKKDKRKWTLVDDFCRGIDIMRLIDGVGTKGVTQRDHLCFIHRFTGLTFLYLNVNMKY